MTFEKEKELLVNKIFLVCLKKKLKIITVESCTGGLISSCITSFPGSSMIFEAGYVTYSNESKLRLLNVDRNNLKEHGAVSLKVAEQMATNIIKDDKTVSIAVTGVAGPGSSEDKPIGLIWLASFKRKKMITKKLELGNLNRSEIREKATIEALKLLSENL